MPVKKLTDLFVANVKPTKEQQDSGARVEYFDASFPGLALRVTSGGHKSWVLFYRIHGRQRRLTIGACPPIAPADARKSAQAALDQVAKGEDPAAAKLAIRNDPLPAVETFGALWRDYLELYAKKNMKPKGIYVLEKTIEADVLPRWEKMALGDITKRHVLQVIDGVVARGADVHANRVFSKLRAIFNWAITRDRIAVSPMTGLAKPTVETERERVLDDDEIRWFWAACEEIGEPFGPIFQLLLLTAQRRSEVAEMVWHELNLPKCVWNLPAPRTKSESSHEVHLAPLARRIIEAAPKPHRGLVFSTTGEDPVSGFSRAKERLDAAMLKIRRRELGLPEDDEALRKALKIAAGKPLPVEIPEWILHDLRRTATTKMAKLKVPPHVADKILNHSSGTIRGVAKIYNREQYLDERREALETWSAWIEQHIGGNAPSAQAPNVVELRR